MVNLNKRSFLLIPATSSVLIDHLTGFCGPCFFGGVMGLQMLPPRKSNYDTGLQMDPYDRALDDITSLNQMLLSQNTTTSEELNELKEKIRTNNVEDEDYRRFFKDEACVKVWGNIRFKAGNSVISESLYDTANSLYHEALAKKWPVPIL